MSRRRKPTVAEQARKAMSDIEVETTRAGQKVGEAAKNIYGAALALVPGTLLRAGLTKAKEALDKATRRK